MKSTLMKIVAKADQAFATNKPDDFLELCADEIQWRMVGEETAKGKDEVRKWMNIGIENGDITFETPKINYTNTIVENQSVASYGEMEIKNKNSEISKFSYCDVYKFRDNKIVELTSFVIRSEL